MKKEEGQNAKCQMRDNSYPNAHYINGKIRLGSNIFLSSKKKLRKKIDQRLKVNWIVK